LNSGELASNARAMRAALPGTADAALAARSITRIAIMPDVNTRMERSHKNGRDGVATAYAGSISFLAFALGTGGVSRPDSILSSVPSRAHASR
jgi:hypothetical protein